MTTRTPRSWAAIAWALSATLGATVAQAQAPTEAERAATEAAQAPAEAEQAGRAGAPCPCAAALPKADPPPAPQGPEADSEAEAHPEPFEPSYIASLAAVVRADGWDDFEGHRSGGGMTAGIDFSPWEPDTELHLELIYLANRQDRLVSMDFGLKVPFHQGHLWDVHGVVGPSLAYDRESKTLEDGETEVRHNFVVGMIVGLGTAYWFHPHWGATLDVNFRVLGGEGISYRLFTSLGVATRW